MPKAKVSATDVHIGQKLRAIRRASRMSQSELGEALNVTYQQIQKYELGHTRMSVPTLLKAAQVFGISPADFYDGSEAVVGSARRSGSRKLDRYAASAEGMAVLKAFAEIRNADVRRQLITFARSLASL